MAQKITDSVRAESVLHDRMAGLDHEEVWIIFLNQLMEVISTEMVSMGTLDTTAIDARTVLRRALLANASAFVMAHNHPSGNPIPSQADIERTKEIGKASKMLGIVLIDHIIICDGCYYSFADEVSHDKNR